MPRKYVPPEDAVSHRYWAMNADEWIQAKAVAHGRGISVRKLIAAAVDSELEPLLASLGADQAKVSRRHRRVPVDEKVLKRLSAGRERAGINSVALLRVCLARHALRHAGATAAAPTSR